jgi:hypothetical protein
MWVQYMEDMSNVFDVGCQSPAEVSIFVYVSVDLQSLRGLILVQALILIFINYW